MENIKLITIKDNEDYLRQASEIVNLQDKNLKEELKKIENYCIEDDAILALAAVQIGIPKRLIYLKNTNLEIIEKQNNKIATEEEMSYNEAKILINPVIIKREGLTTFWESCASCLNYMGLVKRPYRIEVSYVDLDGNEHIEVFEGFKATVFSHEYDHLFGILHIDIASEILDMPVEERIEFKKTNNYTIIKKDGNYEDLIKEYSLKRKLK